MNKAVFLDRDGVVTVENSYTTHPKDVKLFDYAEQCVSDLHKMGYIVVVITNQAGVAKGLYTEDELNAFHDILKQRINVDGIYYCPHHPEGLIERYRIICSCRKPKTGMIEQAAKEHNIDIAKSYIVGDRASDILSGKKAGLKTVLVESGYGSKNMEFDINPDYTFKDLQEFVKYMESHKDIL